MIDLTYGDALKLMDSIDDNSVDVVCTDPPYGISFRSNRRKIQHEDIVNDNNLDWLPGFISQLNRVVKPNAHIYIFSPRQHLCKFVNAIESVFQITNILIWQKNNHGMGDLRGSYAPMYEPIIFCNVGRKPIIGPRPRDIIYAPKTGNILHPTQKPVTLIEALLAKSARSDDTVLDPFCGSGTTAVACMRNNFNFIGYEINKEYYDIAMTRLSEESTRLTLDLGVV